MAALRYALFDTELGLCGIAWSDRGLCRLALPEASREALLARLAQNGAREARPTGAARRAIALVRRHLAGKPPSYREVPLDLDGTPPFRAAVYRALQRLPAGQTISYAELAARAGSAGAARAVGQAMAHNPLPILVPCHRVLAAGGRPGGFSAYGGTVTKARLLELEGVRLGACALGVPGPTSSRLPFDPRRAVRALRRADPELGALIERVGPLRLELRRADSTFASLAEAIVYQQLTGKAAATIYGRLRARVRPFRPAVLARASEAELRAAGLSRSKAAALRDLAERAMRREIPTLARLGRMDDEAIVEALTAVRGIGRWTVEMLLIFELGRPDVLPSGDYGVRKGFARAFGHHEPPPPRVLEERGERWRPHRTVASWYLWRANELS